jgi:hypothetical protein
MKTYIALLLLSACAVSAATEEKFTKTFLAPSGGTIVVDVDFGSIEVVGDSGRSDMNVDVWRKITRWETSDEEAYLKDHPVEFIQEGNTVTIRARGNTRFSWSWFSAWRNRNEAHYTVHVPAEFSTKLKTAGGSIAVDNVSGSVDANTSGGGLRFTNIHGPINGHTSGGGIKVADCDGDVRINTSGGGIDVAGGGGTLHGNTSGGGISVKTFKGPIDISTSGGGITVENIHGQIKGHTSGGPVHAILLTPITADIDLSTSGGGIHVKVSANAAFTLDAETSGGGVSSDLPVTVQGDIGRNHLKGTVNSGGPSVRLHISGGGIHLEKI